MAWVENDIKMSLWLTMEHGMDLKVEWKFVQYAFGRGENEKGC